MVSYQVNWDGDLTTAYRRSNMSDSLTGDRILSWTEESSVESSGTAGIAQHLVVKTLLVSYCR